MDIQDYIQSGIIESYVLGLASAEEASELEQLRINHKEVENAVNEFSVSLERHALEKAIPPPPDLKNKILAAIKDTSNENVSSSLLQKAKHEEVINTPVRSLYSWRMVAAASIILLVLSAALNFYLYNQYNDKKEAYQALLSERQALQANNKVYQTRLNEWKTAAEMMADPAMAMVKMHSVKGRDEAATIFWNTKNKDVYVMTNKLPKPVTGKQYQLWALVNGKPVDAGMIDQECTGACKMKNIPVAQAFAITLEKAGGSPTPHLNELRVMGNI